MKIKRWGFRSVILIVVVLSLAVVLIGCATQAKHEDYYAPAEMEVEKVVTMPAYDTAASSSGSSYQAVYTEDSDWETQSQEQLVIRNASLSIVVKDAGESMKSIETMVDGLNGWIVSSNLWEVNDVKRGNISVRIPAEHLDSFLDQIESLANVVTNRVVTGQDVTDEYVDIQSDLTNLESTRDRVRNFLDDARTVEEALKVNTELSRLEGDIERLTGRMAYLEKSARYSQVSIDITPDALYQPIQVARWQPVGIIKDAVQSLIEAFQFIITILIYLVLLILPVGLVIFGPFYLVIRAHNRRVRRNREKAEAEKKEE